MHGKDNAEMECQEETDKMGEKKPATAKYKWKAEVWKLPLVAVSAIKTSRASGFPFVTGCSLFGYTEAERSGGTHPKTTRNFFFLLPFFVFILLTILGSLHSLMYQKSQRSNNVLSVFFVLSSSSFILWPRLCYFNTHTHTE